MREQQNQQDEQQLQKLIMFDLGPEGLPQVSIALLVRLSRDVQESSTRSLLRKLVPQFRKSAFAVLPLEKLDDFSLLKNSASQVSLSMKNVAKNGRASSFEWNKKSKIKSAVDNTIRSDFRNLTRGFNHAPMVLLVRALIPSFLDERENIFLVHGFFLQTVKV